MSSKSGMEGNRVSVSRQRVKHSKAIVCVIATILGVATAVAPQRIYYEVLWPITICCGIFFHWCDQATPETIDARVSYAFYLVAACAVLFVTWTESSDNIFCKGLTYFVAPLAVCREAVSMRQGLSFIIAHFGILLQKARARGDLFGDGGQWLACTIIIDHTALCMLRTIAALQDARQAESTAYDTFHRLLSFMCDGYFVSRTSGGVIAMDQKTASLLGVGPDFAEWDLVSVVHPAPAAAESMPPGLKILQLRAQNGYTFQVEMYTSAVVSHLLNRILPFLVGHGGFCVKEQPEDLGNSFVFHAFRILGQVEVTDGAEERQGDCGEERRQAGGDRAWADWARPAAIPSMSQVSLKSIDEDSVSEGFGESVATEMPVPRASTVESDHESIGAKIDQMLGFMKNPPNELLAACSDMEAKRQELKAMRRDFKNFIANAYEQTVEQLSVLRGGEGRGPPSQR